MDDATDSFQARLAAARERVAPVHVDRPPRAKGPARTRKEDRGWLGRSWPEPPMPVATTARAHVNSDGTPKVRHRHRESAEMAMDHILADPRYLPKPGRVLGTYPCWCGGWHVGNTKITDSEEPGT